MKLTEKIAYLLGLWEKMRSKKEFGICGSLEEKLIFVKGMIEIGIPPNKIKEEGKCVFVFNSRLEKAFKKWAEKKYIFFGRLNEVTANYLAGIFDASGEINGREVSLRNVSDIDVAFLERIGFRGIERKRRFIFLSPEIFLHFIRPYLKIKKKDVERYFGD